MPHSMISDLNKFIENILNDSYNKMEIIVKCNSREFTVTSKQLGIYIDSIVHPSDVTYNISTMIKINKNVNISKIIEGFNELFKKQEILISKYYEKEIDRKIEVYGFIEDDCSLIFEEYAYENAQTFVRPFKLSEALLIRVGFIKDEVLLIDMHHIISDGYSM